MSSLVQRYFIAFSLIFAKFGFRITSYISLASSISLASASQPQDQVQGRLLLDVVVGQGSSVLQLLTSEDEPLLIWGNALLVLDLGLDVFDGVRGLDRWSCRSES